MGECIPGYMLGAYVAAAPGRHSCRCSCRRVAQVTNRCDDMSGCWLQGAACFGSPQMVQYLLEAYETMPCSGCPHALLVIAPAPARCTCTLHLHAAPAHCTCTLHLHLPTAHAKLPACCAPNTKPLRVVMPAAQQHEWQAAHLCSWSDTEGWTPPASLQRGASATCWQLLAV